MKVLFLDIDGPLIPGRAYAMPGQTKPIVKKFDPCAVGIINEVCWKQHRKLVIHSSWVKFIDEVGGDLKEYMISEGLSPQIWHSDPICSPLGWRYDRVNEWLSRHEVEDFKILDDVPCNDIFEEERLKEHLLLIDFENGITMDNWREMQNW